MARKIRKNAREMLGKCWENAAIFLDNDLTQYICISHCFSAESYIQGNKLAMSLSVLNQNKEIILAIC